MLRSEAVESNRLDRIRSDFGAKQYFALVRLQCEAVLRSLFGANSYSG